MKSKVLEFKGGGHIGLVCPIFCLFFTVGIGQVNFYLKKKLRKQ